MFQIHNRPKSVGFAVLKPSVNFPMRISILLEACDPSAKGTNEVTSGLKKTSVPHRFVLIFTVSY